MKNQNSKHKPVHVLQILGNAIVGGMETSVINLISSLPRDEYRITVLCPYESVVTRTLRDLNCKLFIAPVEDDPRWRSIQMVVELVRRLGIDLLHAHLPNAHALAGLASALTGTPAVATVHGMEVSTQELGIQRTTGTHLIMVCHQAYLQALTLGIPERKLSLIYNGVATDAAASDPIAGLTFRAAVGVPAGALLVGFVGRLAHEKGPDQFVRAAREVAARRDDAHFVLVGNGPMREELESMIQELGLAQRVHLAGRWDDVRQVYPALDVLAQTSRAEGSSLVLLEAMANKRPVVAIAVGGVLELVEHGATGYITGPGDWQGVAQLIVALLNDSEQRKRMGDAGWERVQNDFSLSQAAHHTAELYDRLAGHPGSVRRKLSPARAERKSVAKKALT